MKKLFLILIFLMISNLANAGCDDPLKDGVDYTNCRFSEGQDLQGSFCQIQIYLLRVSFKLILIKAL